MGLTADNSFWSNFTDRKIMIVVPHQDDELFLCGTILGGLRKVTKNIFVVFTTNGDYGNDFKIRKRESIRAMRTYDIVKDHIIFLGYGDQYDTDYKHMYHAPKDAIVKSKAGFDSTYGEEFFSKKYGKHHSYTLDNFSKDLMRVLEIISPDIIFCNDLDWHPEHRFTSLVFDRVLGMILSGNESYHPEVYKGFVYYLGWDGKLDYKKRNLENTKKLFRYEMGDKRFEMGNPYLRWNERICFPIDAYEVSIKKNRLYKAISKYHFSKNAKRFYKSMMNADAVFWKRETYNLLLKSIIKVSSGEGKYLNDFVIADSNDITERIMKFDSSVWYPNAEDRKPEICLDLKEPKRAKEIVFYRDVKSYASYECNLSINISGMKDNAFYKYEVVHVIKKYDLKTVVTLDQEIEIDSIKITMENNLIGLSEIELLELNSPNSEFIKISINGIYAYKYIVEKDDTELLVDIRSYGNKEVDLIKEILDIKPKHSTAKWEDNRIIISTDLKSCFIKATSRVNSDKYDLIQIVRG